MEEACAMRHASSGMYHQPSGLEADGVGLAG
jgi:hypothetical protein